MPATFPLNSDKPCKYPYMYIDTPTAIDRRRYFANNKYKKLIDTDYKIHPCYIFTMNAFKNLLTVFINQENLDDMDRICIYFGLYDDRPSVPAGCQYSFAFIFATERKTIPPSNITYYIIDPNNDQVKQMLEEDVKQWRGLYEYNILPKLQDTLDSESVQLGDSPTDTKSISYDVIGLSQIYREMDYQNRFNNLNVTGIKIYFSSFRTKDLDPKHPDYPTCYPQRLITQLEIVEEINNEPFELDIKTTPDFQFRIQETRPSEAFDTGNLCPPICQP